MLKRNSFRNKGFQDVGLRLQKSFTLPMERGRILISADAFNVLSELVSRISVLSLPAEAGKWYGIMRAALERNGEMIGANDIWIAAHAKSTGLTLVTNNEREFKRIPGLNVENWVK